MGNHNSVPARLARCSLQNESLESVAADKDLVTSYSGMTITPTEVIYHNIFPYLDFNDLLRLRRVCRKLKASSEDYIRNYHFNHGRVIGKNEHTLSDFIRIGIPSNRIYLKISDTKIFKDPLLSHFSNLYTQYITHLRVEFLPSTVLQSKNNLCCSLRNLEHLEVTKFVFCDSWYENCGINNWRGRMRLNMCFDKIKTLKISESCCPPGQYYQLHNRFPNLEYLMCSRYTQTNQQESQALQHTQLWKTVAYIQLRGKNYPDKPNLKILDLQGCKLVDVGITPRDYRVLMHLLSRLGVKLLNFDAELHKLLLPKIPDDELRFKFPMVSMTNVHGELDIRALSYLEKFEITGPCKVRVLQQRDFQLSELSEVYIMIDEELLQHKRNITARSANIIDVLFNKDFGTKDKLKKLKMRFGERAKMPYGRHASNLWAFRFVDNCRHLTALTLVNWIGKGRELFILWKNLDQLESLELSNCKTVDDYSFLGFEFVRPAFLWLTKLVKLTLSGLDVMPGITSMAFENVFRHIRIKEFYLKSDKPIKSITLEGIRYLLNGEFAKTVERFPFEGWSHENTSTEELARLSMEFRSYHRM